MTRRQTSLRPAEGGRFHPAVEPKGYTGRAHALKRGDNEGICAEHEDPREAACMLRTVKSKPDWSDVASYAWLVCLPCRLRIDGGHRCKACGGEGTITHGDASRLRSDTMSAEPTFPVIKSAVWTIATGEHLHGRIRVAHEDHSLLTPPRDPSPGRDVDLGDAPLTFADLAVGDLFIMERSRNCAEFMGNAEQWRKKLDDTRYVCWDGLQMTMSPDWLVKRLEPTHG